MTKSGYALATRERVTLSEGAEVRNVVIKMQRNAKIIGHVRDRERQALAGVQVSAWRKTFQEGRPIFARAALAMTNDLGEYRLTGLSPGKYFISALQALLQPHSPQQHDPGKPQFSKISLFYPNARTIDEAAPVYIQAGQEVGGIDVNLEEVETHCVSSSVTAPGESLPQVSLMLLGMGMGGANLIGGGLVKPGDAFEFCGLPSGQFRLMASAFVPKGGIARLAATTITVASLDRTETPLVLAPGAELAGSVIVEGLKAEDPLPDGIHIRLEPVNRLLSMGENVNTTVDKLGRFSFSGLLVDDYMIRVDAPAWYVKEISDGGRDLLRQPVTPGAANLRVVLAADGALIGGRVVDADRGVVKDAVVILAPKNGREFLRQWVDQDGRFQFGPRPPGEYRLLALRDVSEQEAGDPDEMAAYLGAGVTVTLGPRANNQVQLIVQTAGKH